MLVLHTSILYCKRRKNAQLKIRKRKKKEEEKSMIYAYQNKLSLLLSVFSCSLLLHFFVCATIIKRKKKRSTEWKSVIQLTRSIKNVESFIHSFHMQAENDFFFRCFLRNRKKLKNSYSRKFTQEELCREYKIKI